MPSFKHLCYENKRFQRVLSIAFFRERAFSLPLVGHQTSFGHYCTGLSERTLFLSPERSVLFPLSDQRSEPKPGKQEAKREEQPDRLQELWYHPGGAQLPHPATHGGHCHQRDCYSGTPHSLHHCLFSYVFRVIANVSSICFLAKNAISHVQFRFSSSLCLNVGLP